MRLNWLAGNEWHKPRGSNAILKHEGCYRPQLESLEDRCLLSITPSFVEGRYVFYDHSKYDGGIAGVNAADDLAIASNKTALLRGQGATFANVTSYSAGLNGIMVDISGSHPDITADDFIFRTGNNNQPGTWSPAPAPLIVTVRGGAGVGGSDRVEIVWPSGAIKQQWLEVIVSANPRTGLATSDEFFFGNQIAESGQGNSGTALKVDIADEAAARNHPAALLSNIPVSNMLDYNRDGKVDVSDQALARNNAVSQLSGLKLFNLPTAPPPSLNAVLADDTGPGGQPDNDGITTDSTITGTLTAPNGLTSFRIGLNHGPITTDAMSLLHSGTFTLTPEFLAAMNGGPLAAGDYTVQLQATDALGMSAMSEVTFTLQIDPLGAFSITGPTGTQSTNRPTATWTPSAGAVSYTLSITYDAAGQNAFHTYTNITQPSFTLPGLENGFWHICVTAFDSAGNQILAANNGLLITVDAPFHYMFVTSAVFTAAEIGGLENADDIVTLAAYWGGLIPDWNGVDRVYRAILSTSMIDARDRVPFDRSIFNRNNELITFGTGLWDGSLLDAPMYDEYGTLLGDVPVWTGTNADGTWSGESASDWTSNDGLATAGLDSALDELMFDNGDFLASQAMHIYAIGPF